MEPSAKEAERAKRFEAYNESIIFIMGFIGALLFAGLILLVQSPQYITEYSSVFTGNQAEQYFQFLVGFLSVLCGLTVIAALMSLRALSGRYVNDAITVRHRLFLLVEYVSGAVFIGFIVAIGLLLVPISFELGISVYLILSVLFTVFAALNKHIRGVPV